MVTRKLLTIAIGIMLLSGCAANSGSTNNAGNAGNTSNAGNTGNTNNAGGTSTTRSYSSPLKIRSNEESPALLTDGGSSVPIKTIQNTPYVALEDLAKVVGLRGKWLPDGSFGIGDTDPEMMFRAGESGVAKEDQRIQLPAPTVSEGNKLYVPAAGLQQLFGDEAGFNVEADRVAFVPNPATEDTESASNEPDFQDDPSESGPESEPATPFSINSTDGRMNGFAVRNNADRNKLVNYADNFMGIKYDFGASPYSSSNKRFDCSTFVQKVYGQFGYKMPRLARAQAKRGQTVARNKLKKGDLLFFYVPGRFKTNKTVGHVAIYYGNGKMIHASPKPQNGVQLTNINKPYWKNTFLYAKRNF
ncbi:MAG: C40 family peptidase [Cohnella sp.]|nr:C40 family peptidase [Cohnella sp.]